MSEEPGGRIIWADVARVYAIFLVILLHVAAVLVYDTRNVGSASWWAGNVYDSFARMSVPLFIMLSGTLLLDETKIEPTFVFFRKRLKKILIPFLVWSAVYLIWSSTFHRERISIREILYRILTVKIYYHLWFMYVIVGLYLITPLVRAFMGKVLVKKKMQVAFLLLFLACLSVIFKNHLPYYVVVPFSMAGYVGYFISGNPLSKIRLLQSFHLVLSVAVIIATIVTAVGTFYLNNDGAVGFESLMYKYFSPNVIVASICAFLLLKAPDYGRLLKGRPRLLALLGDFSKASFGVYLVHAIVLELLWYGAGLDGNFINPFIGIVLTALCCTVISFLFIKVIRIVPVLRFITP